MAGLVFPPEIENATHHPSYIQFDIFDRRKTTSSVLSNHIVLFMPDEVRSPNTSRWEESSYLEMANDVAAGSSVASLLRNVAARVGGLAGYTLGEAINPRVVMMFKGVDLRKFSMSFVLSPRTVSESEIIDKIVRTFRGAAVPPGSFSNFNPTFSYPQEFEIKYMFKGQQNKYLQRYLRCVLTSVEADHMNTGQFAVFRTGAPVRTLLTLNFTEIDIILRDDIINGGY